VNAEQLSPSILRLSRRDFLRRSAAGCCLLGLGGLAGWSFPARGEDKPSPAAKGLIRPRRSPWFRELEGGSLRCLLCPKECELKPGDRGSCRVRVNRSGAGYTLAYGNPALVREGPVEQTPFYHFLPGSRTLAISTAGCPLACKFCETWAMALTEPEEIYNYDLPPARALERARAAGVASLSYAFGEPAAFYEYMADLAEQAKAAGLSNLVQTSGYLQFRPLKELASLLDGANVDLKGFDPAFYREYVGGELKPVLDSILLLREQGVHLEITNILIPPLNDNPEMIGKMCRWIKKELGPDVPLHFSRFYPLYRLSNLPPTSVPALDRARKTALEAGLRYVYVSRVAGHPGEDTVCPACGEIVIKRMGFFVDEFRLEKGRCPKCATSVPGRWS